MFILRVTLKSLSGKSLTDVIQTLQWSPLSKHFNGQADFGRRVTCTISRNGDLAYRTYLQGTLPEINQNMATPGDSVYARWLDFPR